MTMAIDDIRSSTMLSDPLERQLDGTLWPERLSPLLRRLVTARTSRRGERFTDDAIAQDLRTGGFTRLWMSQDWDGEQVTLGQGIAVVAALASVDASVGWQTGVQGAIGRISDYLPLASPPRSSGPTTSSSSDRSIRPGGTSPTARTSC